MSVMQVQVTDGVLRLIVDRPPLNILTRAVLAKIRGAVEAAGDDPNVRVVLLSAVGKHFSAGADVGEHLPPAFEDMIPEFLETVRVVADCPVPTVAAVRGKCLGGAFELIQAVDFVFAGDNAWFGQPEIQLGVLPPAACALLPRLISPRLATEIVLTGESIPSRRAAELGLVYRVTEVDVVDQEAGAFAGKLAAMSGAALRAGKRMLAVVGNGRGEALARAGELYRDELMQTHDAVEGLQAFLDKRTPVWRHE